MPAYVNLPWLNTSDQFMQALQAGSRAGLERERLANELKMEVLRRVSFGGGGGGGGPTPFEQAKQDWLQQYQAGQLEQGAEANRIAREKAEREQRSQGYSLGRGGFAVFNPNTEEVKVVREPAGPAASEPTVSVPIFPEGTDPLTAHLFGVSPITVRGAASKIIPYMGTNVPPVLRNFGAPGGAQILSPEAPTGPTISLKQQKVQRANQLSQEHPDWTNERIINAVNRELGQ